MGRWLRSFALYCREKPREALVVLVFIVAILGLLRLHLRTQADENWEQFKVEHNCKPMAARGGNNIKTGWVCDDGEEYFRWRQQL